MYNLTYKSMVGEKNFDFAIEDFTCMIKKETTDDLSDYTVASAILTDIDTQDHSALSCQFDLWAAAQVDLIILSFENINYCCPEFFLWLTGKAKFSFYTELCGVYENRIVFINDNDIAN